MMSDLKGSESTKGYLNKYTNVITMQAVQTQKKKSTKEYQREWRAKNPEYFTDYYKAHPESYAKSHGKYMRTKKGKKSQNKFESSEKRKKYKRNWMRNFRAKKEVKK